MEGIHLAVACQIACEFELPPTLQHNAMRMNLYAAADLQQGLRFFRLYGKVFLSGLRVWYLLHMLYI